jgi:SAM-dependent methyltransferase
MRKINRQAVRVLDVGCGSGEHIHRLAAHGFVCDGIDVNEDFLELARRKHPVGRFVCADMFSLNLPDRYDAVLCLFSVIGYAQTRESLGKALGQFRDHLKPGGVVAVEPWFWPGWFTHNETTHMDFQGEGITVSRTFRVELSGRTSRVHYEYEIVDESGTHHAQEVHELGLFTQDEMMDTFSEVGLVATPRVDYNHRGLYVATLAS